MKVLLTGSYDPITNGHVSLIEKCAELFEEVHVIAFLNAQKINMFSAQERRAMLGLACAAYENVVTGSDDGYVVDYAAKHGISVLIRGVRNADDFIYEKQMADNNHALSPGITTLFIPADRGWEDISSHVVREKLTQGEDIASLVPPSVDSYIKKLAEQNGFIQGKDVR
ncbi:MAG: pantetheine-phosphate adenylyltransferase [Clostridiales bacterium]|nr:pantetheine-phosphate adenylyltransferase [Clostridiales bacterium]